MLSVHKLSSPKAAVNYFKGNYYTPEDDHDTTSNEVTDGTGNGISGGSGVGAGSGFGESNNTRDTSRFDDGTGLWAGKGPGLLGLSGTVTESEFSQILNGRLPNGIQLGRMENGELVHTPGWDFTFSAPKSASILYEIGGDARIIDAHNAAVNTALSYLESNSVGARLTINGFTDTVQTKNIVVAKFTHHESRDLDPQLHTHSVIANMTTMNNGEVRSLDSRNLFRDKMIAGLIYRNELANSLREQGYNINQTHKDGRFVLEGVSRGSIDYFSKRRAEIEEKLKTSITQDAKAAARVALITRSSKKDMSLSDLREKWQTEVANVDLDIDKIIKDTEANVVQNNNDAARESVDYALKYHSEGESVFTNSKLLFTALSYKIGSISVEEINQEVNSRVEDGSLLEAKLDRQAAFTTKRSLFLERANVAIMNDAKGTVSPIASDSIIRKSLNEQGLKLDQYEAAKAILSTPDRIIGVQGYAGTGKTYMLEKVNRIASEQKLVIKGFAPTSSAAKQLESSSAIKSSTVASLLASNKSTIESNNAKNIDSSNELWVVDESSMLSNHDAYELLKLSELTGARVVLVGDKKQLPAIEAGKPFAYLQKNGMQVVTMDKIIRQQNESALNAVVHSIHGDIERSMAAIEDNVVEIEDRSERLKAIADKFLNLPINRREESLVATPLNKDRILLNTIIRDGLLKEGRLKGEGIDTQIYSKISLKRAEKGDIRNYESGYILQFNKDYKSIGVEKGEYVKVIAVNENGTLSIIKGDSDKPIAFRPERYASARRGGFEVFTQESRKLNIGEKIRWTTNNKELNVSNSETAKVVDIGKDKVGFMVNYNGKDISVDMDSDLARRWEYAYVSTLYSAQGKTADSIIFHGDDYHKIMATQKSHYTGLSRAKNDIHIFVDQKSSYIETVKNQLGDKTSAMESVNRSSKNTVDGSRIELKNSMSHKSSLITDHNNYDNYTKSKPLIKDKVVSRVKSR